MIASVLCQIRREERKFHFLGCHQSSALKPAYAKGAPPVVLVFVYIGLYRLIAPEKILAIYSEFYSSSSCNSLYLLENLSNFFNDSSLPNTSEKSSRACLEASIKSWFDSGCIFISKRASFEELSFTLLLKTNFIPSSPVLLSE